MRGIRSSSKRKWVVGGAVIFAAAALLTTGFATWIVGSQNLKSTNNVNVTVDTAENNFLEFTYTLGSSTNAIKLAEDKATKDAAASENDIVKLEGTDFVENPLRITGEVSIAVGRTYLTAHPIKGIEFTIEPKIAEGAEGYSADEASVVVKSADNLLKNADVVGVAYRAESPDYTYLRAPVATTFTTPLTTAYEGTEWTLTNNGDVFIFKKALSVDFRWGTFFGNDTDEKNNSPFAYYNHLDLTGRSADQKANVYGAVTGELNQMHDLLDGKHIRLLAELTF